jgi:hypothetical protein
MRMFVWTLLIFPIVVPVTSARAAQKCQPGYITCAQWCAKNRTDNCMTGHPNSCDKKSYGASTCVRDSGR